MSGAGLTSIGVRAMLAANAGLRTTGHNIANAHTEGYSRQRVEVATSIPRYTGAGFVGNGVDATTVTRIYDEYLARDVLRTTSQASYDESRHGLLQRLEKAFALGEQGIGHAGTQFFSALADMATRPEDLAARQAVLGRAREMAARFNGAAAQLDTLRTGARSDLQAQVAQVNDLTARIARVNQEIAALNGRGQPPNDLLDQRDQLVRELGTFVPVSTVPATDGTLSVFLGSGQSLVLGSHVSALTVDTDPDDPSLPAVFLEDAAGDRMLSVDDALAGGKVGGTLRFIGSDLEAAQDHLDTLAWSMARAVNAVQTNPDGRDLTGTVGSALFTLAGVSPATALTDREGAAAAIAVHASFAAEDLAASTSGGDNQNALRLTELRDRAFVGLDAGPPDEFEDLRNAAWTPPAGRPLRDFNGAWSDALTDVGVRVQGARTASEMSSAAATAAEDSLNAVNGVNLDEEAARLIQYQQSFQAAAKVLQIAQGVFDALLDATAR